MMKGMSKLFMLSATGDKKHDERDYYDDYDRYERKDRHSQSHERMRYPEYDEYDGYGKRDYYGEHERKSKKRGKLSREDADEWVESMKNTDGSSGAHWTYEQTEQVRKQHGYDCDPNEFFAALNMVYSDYFKVCKEFNLNSVDFYAKMAHAFLDDEDAVDGKIERYYECVVE